MQRLYLIECQGFYKIGVAYNVTRRLAELATGNPFELQLLAVYEFSNAQIVEQSLHQRYKKSHARGEWFFLTEQDIQIFHDLCQGLGGIAPNFFDESESDIDADHVFRDQERDAIMIQEREQAKALEQEYKGNIESLTRSVLMEMIKENKVNLSEAQRRVYGISDPRGGKHFEAIQRVYAEILAVNNES